MKPMALEVSSAVSTLNTSVSEIEMSLRVVSGGVCKGIMACTGDEMVCYKGSNT